MNKQLKSWKAKWSISLQLVNEKKNIWRIYRGDVSRGLEFTPNFHSASELDVALLQYLGREMKTNGYLRDQLREVLVENRCFVQFVEIFNG